jgi:hypothetical protein
LPPHVLLKADDGIERTAEQYFKRYNPQDPAKAVPRKSSCRMAMLTIPLFTISEKLGKTI